MGPLIWRHVGNRKKVRLCCQAGAVPIGWSVALTRHRLFESAGPQRAMSSARSRRPGTVPAGARDPRTQTLAISHEPRLCETYSVGCRQALDHVTRSSVC